MNITNVGVLVLAVASSVLAGDQATASNFGKAPAATVSVRASTAAATTQSVSNSAINSNPMREVIAKEITIAAKDYALFEVPLDFNGTEKVGIAVTTLSDSSSSLAK